MRDCDDACAIGALKARNEKPSPCLIVDSIIINPPMLILVKRHCLWYSIVVELIGFEVVNLHDRAAASGLLWCIWIFTLVNLLGAQLSVKCPRERGECDLRTCPQIAGTMKSRVLLQY